MDNSTDFFPKVEKLYPISWFYEPFSLLVSMFYQLYGLPNYTEFKTEWDPIAHHILLTRKSFNGRRFYQ